MSQLTLFREKTAWMRKSIQEVKDAQASETQGGFGGSATIFVLNIHAFMGERMEGVLNLAEELLDGGKVVVADEVHPEPGDMRPPLAEPVDVALDIETLTELVTSWTQMKEKGGPATAEAFLRCDTMVNRIRLALEER